MELKELYSILEKFEGSNYKNYEIINLMFLKNGTINIFLKAESHNIKVNSKDL